MLGAPASSAHAQSVSLSAVHYIRGFYFHLTHPTGSSAMQRSAVPRLQFTTKLKAFFHLEIPKKRKGVPEIDF